MANIQILNLLIGAVSALLVVGVLNLAWNNAVNNVFIQLKGLVSPINGARVQAISSHNTYVFTKIKPGTKTLIRRSRIFATRTD